IARNVSDRGQFVRDSESLRASTRRTNQSGRMANASSGAALAGMETCDKTRKSYINLFSFSYMEDLRFFLTCQVCSEGELSSPDCGPAWHRNCTFQSMAYTGSYCGGMRWKVKRVNSGGHCVSKPQWNKTPFDCWSW